MKKRKSSVPLVSIILAVYNGEKFLDDSIKSVLNQTFRDFELIIVDDCSTDNSLNIIKSYRDKRIKLIKNKKNKGSFSSYNIGLKNSKGKYVAFCTQDDISHPKRIELEFNYLEENPHIFLLGTSAIYIDEEGKEIRRFRKYDDYKLLAWRLRKSCSIIFPSVMLRNEDISLDNHFEYHLYYKLLKRGKNLNNLPNFLVKYRVHSRAESVRDKEKQERLKKEVLEKFREMEDNTAIFNKLFFSIKLFYHYILTMKEKKII